MSEGVSCEGVNDRMSEWKKRVGNREARIENQESRIFSSLSFGEGWGEV